jgi:hypothetical protein
LEEAKFAETFVNITDINSASAHRPKRCEGDFRKGIQNDSHGFVLVIWRSRIHSFTLDDFRHDMNRSLLTATLVTCS